MPENNELYNLIVVLGPTATGKTRFAAELAAHIGGEIISADSRQIYRRMDLGTGKDYEDYKVNGKNTPYHLIDIHEPGYKYNVYEYQKDFLESFSHIISRNKKAILCGGTGMYIEAVTSGYKLLAVPINPELRKQLDNKTLSELVKILHTYRTLHNISDSDTIKRAVRAIEIEEHYIQYPETDSDYPEIRPAFLGILCEREIRRQRITSRLKSRLDAGMIEEVKGLLDEGIPASDLIYYGLEYKFITLYLTGELSYAEMTEKLNIAIHQFAKRQMTWFRKMERQGIKIHWIDTMLPVQEKLNIAGKYLRH